MGKTRINLLSIVKNNSLILLGIVFLMIPSQAQRNAKISGVVRNAQTGKPVELTNVYLSGTTLGSSTDNQGNFSIEKIPYGTYELVASHVSYQLYINRVPVRMGEKLYYEINLHPKIFKGTEIEIKGDDPEKWRRLFKKFKKIFIGTSKNSADCRIVNPEVIDSLNFTSIIKIGC